MLYTIITRKQVLVESRVTRLATIYLIKHKDNTSTAIFASQISPIKDSPSPSKWSVKNHACNDKLTITLYILYFTTYLLKKKINILLLILVNLQFVYPMNKFAISIRCCH